MVALAVRVKTRPIPAAAGSRCAHCPRGYLVEVPGHCSACNRPRSFTLQEKALSSGDGKLYLSGGSAVDGWIPPSLRNEHGGGLADWGENDIVQLWKTARSPHSATFGGMNDVVVHSMQYLTDGDLAGMAAHLKSLPPNNAAAPYVYDDAAAKALFNGDAPAATAPMARVMDGCSRRWPAILCCGATMRHPPSTWSSRGVPCPQRRLRLPPSSWRPMPGF
jgi:hypothetical protein